MPRVVLSTMNTLDYPQGGHLWVYLNWALSFVARGFEVTWLDLTDWNDADDVVARKLGHLRARLRPYGLGDAVTLLDQVTKQRHAVCDDAGCPDLDGDLLFNFRLWLPPDVVSRYRRTAMLDTDPGMVQYNLHHSPTFGHHDACFTVGNDTFADAGGDYIATGRRWHTMTPAIALDQWPATPMPPAASGAAFTTVSHWYMMDAWMCDEQGEVYFNDKRTAFEPYLAVARQAGVPMRLALHLDGDDVEETRLRDLGWDVVEAHDVAGTLVDYRSFVQGSLGEFSGCKPSYRRQQTGWVSDRTACYLASGRPCVVEHNGDRPELEGGEGVLRFKDVDEAAAMLQAVAADPERHSAAARRLAEEHFDGRKCVDRVLEVLGGV